MSRLASFKNWLLVNPVGKLFLQFVKFGLVGVTNTALAYGIYALVLWRGGHYILASVLSFVISVAWSFLLNNRFVFRKEAGETRVWWKTLLKTYLAYASTGLLLANVLLYLWIDILNVNEYVAFFLNLIITIPANFLINKLWAFRNKKQDCAENAPENGCEE